MNALIPLQQSIVSGEEKQTVNARDLHEFLEVTSKFADWIKNRIKDFNFEENQDYVTLSKNLANGGRQIEYYLTLDMGKELSMVERNDKGKQARQYFIACENKLKQHAIPKTFPEALRLAATLAEEVEFQKEQIALAAPKVEVFEKFMEGTNYKTMGAVAKALGTGRNRLFAFLKDNDVLMRNGVPYQEFIERGYFVVKEKPLTMGEANINYTQTYVTAKGEVWIAKLLERKAA